MFSKPVIGTVAAIAAILAVSSSPVLADDWGVRLDRHYAETERTKYQPKEGSEWGFSLSNVMNDMEWRKRTMANLRSMPRPSLLPRPSQTLESERNRQTVEKKAEPRRLSAF